MKAAVFKKGELLSKIIESASAHRGKVLTEGLLFAREVVKIVTKVIISTSSIEVFRDDGEDSKIETAFLRRMSVVNLDNCETVARWGTKDSRRA
jgi:hypothetical protein